jgi:phenylacetate-CoA ligase
MGALRSWAYSSVLLPVFERERHAGLHRRLREYDRLSRRRTEELNALGDARLNDLILHAFDTVPFYRDRLTSAGYRRGDRVDASAMKQIPVLTRQDMLNHQDELWSRAYKKEELQVSATGGTTSVPVTFYRNPAALIEKTALQWHLNGFANYHPGDSIFYLWGAQVDYAVNPSWRWRMYERHFLRSSWAQTSRLDDNVFAEHVQRLNQIKPHIVYAYTTPLVDFCDYLARVQPKFHRPKTVICTAEILAPEQRELIENVMGCEVFMHYGSRELGMTGSECCNHRMHTVPTALYIENIPLEDAEHGVCEIVTTDLINRGMPFIRYKINDCVIPDKTPCNCGLGYPLMGYVIGRVGDMLIMPDGTKLPGISMSSISIRVMKDWPGISDIQFIQNELGCVTMRYVAAPSFTEEHLTRLLPRLREYFHPEIRWSFERVSEIPRERSGKTRFTICNLPRHLVEAGAAR